MFGNDFSFVLVVRESLSRSLFIDEVSLETLQVRELEHTLQQKSDEIVRLKLSLARADDISVRSAVRSELANERAGMEAARLLGALAAVTEAASATASAAESDLARELRAERDESQVCWCARWTCLFLSSPLSICLVVIISLNVSLSVWRTCVPFCSDYFLPVAC